MLPLATSVFLLHLLLPCDGVVAGSSDARSARRRSVELSICVYDDVACTQYNSCTPQSTDCLFAGLPDPTYNQSIYSMFIVNGTTNFVKLFYNDSNCTVPAMGFPPNPPAHCNQCFSNVTWVCTGPAQPHYPPPGKEVSPVEANAVAGSLIAFFFVAGFAYVYYRMKRTATKWKPKPAGDVEGQRLSRDSQSMASLEKNNGSAIVVGGGGGAGSGSSSAQASAAQFVSSSSSSGSDGKPLQNILVVFVLGGPGAGKGTQCANIVRDYGMLHLSSGDLLRKEVESGSPQGKMIDEYMKEGKLVPGDVVISLLRAAIEQGSASYPGFLVDGYPREVQQALDFESKICRARLVLYFECGEEAMTDRLLKRGQTSGRVDDNIEAIKKRFHVFRHHSIPVIEYFDKQDRHKVAKIDAERSPAEVYVDVQEAFKAHGIAAKHI